MAPWIADSTERRGITRFTNCRVVRGRTISHEDLYVSRATGKVVAPQSLFFEQRFVADATIDLEGRLVAPGLLDVQLNGGFGLDFSDVPARDADLPAYVKRLRAVNRQLVRAGVTAYLPTLTSQRADVYARALPLLRPSGRWRDADDGAESLGAHCEGPFLAPTKKGCHPEQVLRTAPAGLADVERVYGAANLAPGPDRAVAMITAAPELPGLLDAIPALAARGIVCSVGHTAADYETAAAAVGAGASMITHLFNAMRPLDHRSPNVFGVLAAGEPHARPYFGVIADGIHLHRSAVTLAHAAHPDGFILVSDAMALTGLPDGLHAWTNGAHIRKQGRRLTLDGTDTIAGAAVSLLECVVNFWNWSGVGLADALAAASATPARMLGLEDVKGSLAPGADADLLVLRELDGPDGWKDLEIDQVWKFGACVYDRTETD